MADFYAILTSGADPETINAALEEMRAKGSTWVRLTQVNNDYPEDGRDHGLYLQGYKKRPDNDSLEPSEAYGAKPDDDADEKPAEKPKRKPRAKKPSNG